MPGFLPVGTPYCIEDLSGLKKADLAVLIRKQIDRWPTPPFNPSKMTMAAMKNALLNQANGFSKPGLLNYEGDSPLTSAPATPRPLSREHTSTPADNVQETMGESSQHPAIVSLLLEDRRFHPARKSAVRIAINTVDSGNGDQYVSAKEVINKLQHSHSALAGSVKLGSPYPLNPSYIEYFTQAVNGNTLENAQCSPETLLVTSSALEIVVEEVNEINKDLGFPSGSITIEEGHHELNASPQDAKQSKSEALVVWLKEKVALQDDYPLFLASHHRVLQNPDVVSTWKFASNIYKIFYGAKNPISKTLIKKSTIFAALGVHETWLSDALSGDRLVGIYGSGGPREDAVVVSELKATRDPPRGRVSLLKFLQNWEVEHPCIS